MPAPEPALRGLGVARVAKRAARGEPADYLAGELRDPVVILVVVEDRDACGFRCRCDQEIRMFDCAVVQAPLVGELSVDVERALPLRLPDRAVRERVEVFAQGTELAGVLSAVEQLEAHHVAGGDFAVDEGLIEASPQFAADGTRPAPRARVRELHLRELPRTAHLAERLGRQKREVARGKPLACLPVDDLPQSCMNGRRGLGRAQHH